MKSESKLLNLTKCKWEVQVNNFVSQKLNILNRCTLENQSSYTQKKYSSVQIVKRKIMT